MNSLATSGAPHLVEMKDDVLLAEACGLVDGARQKGVTLRILGAMAVYAHSKSKNTEWLMRHLGRFEGRTELFTDIDFAGYSKQRKEIGRFMEQVGYKPAVTINALFGNRRLIYYHPQNRYAIDIFLDKLEFSHDVLFGEKPGSGRLELDSPTIPITDVVLEKLQIHQINRKDLIDLVVVFAGHDVGETFSTDHVDGSYVSKMFGEDWGFWYDGVTNLDKVTSFASSLTAEGKLTNESEALVKDRVNKLRSLIDAYPKSDKWAKRSEKGTSKIWYREVEEVTR